MNDFLSEVEQSYTGFIITHNTRRKISDLINLPKVLTNVMR